MASGERYTATMIIFGLNPQRALGVMLQFEESGFTVRVGKASGERKNNLYVAGTCDAPRMGGTVCQLNDIRQELKKVGVKQATYIQPCRGCLNKR